METLWTIYHRTVGTGKPAWRLYMLRSGVGHSVSRKFDLYETRPTLARFLLNFFRAGYGNRAIYNLRELSRKSVTIREAVAQVYTLSSVSCDNSPVILRDAFS